MHVMKLIIYKQGMPMVIIPIYSEYFNFLLKNYWKNPFTRKEY